MADRSHGVFGSFFSKASVMPTRGSSSASSDDDDVRSNDDVKEDVAFRAVRKKSSPKGPSEGGVGQIAIDLYDEGDYLIIKAPIAGVKLADLDIDVNGNTLTVRGERAQPDEVEGDYLLQECFWGAFERSVSLPFSPNPSRVKATFNKDSILKIYIPKEKKVKIVRINEGGS